MPLRASLKHLGIYTHDLGRLEKYYTKVFGMIVTDRGVAQGLQRPVVFMSADADNHHQLVLVGGRDLGAGASTINQISFRVDTLQDLREIRRRLLEAHDAPVSCIDHGNGWSLYSEDPEGNGVEAYADSPWHVEQPRGRPFDLGLDDATILRESEAAARMHPTFSTREAWQQQLALQLSRQQS